MSRAYALLAFVLLGVAVAAQAHPMVEHALDVVIEPDRVVIDARISAEQILLTEAKGNPRPSPDQWNGLIQKHATYMRDHLRVIVDGMPARALTATLIDPMVGAAPSSLVSYRLEYPIPHQPRTVQLDQSFLRELDGWSATCIVRFRQSTQSAFETSLLPSSKVAFFGCEWPAVDAQAGAKELSGGAPIRTTIRVWPTIGAYTLHGIAHILTGYDHLLFVSALVLAATSIGDLVKVVSAFTLAHTLTLTLSVFNIVSLGERVVEPMIAASIVFVAAQNVFWPQRSRGWTRLGIAFAFGLFHGLGFAGGLKDAMAGMPSIALWAALGAFSLGVEIGHQVVVVPLYSALYAAKHSNAEFPRLALAGRVRQACSIAICLAGLYFLTRAVQIP